MNYFNNIDWDRVAEAAFPPESPTHYDFDEEEILEAVYRAAERYLNVDLDLFKIEGIEQEFNYEHLGENHKGFIDLWGTLYTSPDNVVIVDWKTTGSLDDSWEFREVHSDQPVGYYLALKSLGRVRMGESSLARGNYYTRGISRTGQTKQVGRAITPELLAEHDQQKQMWLEIRDKQIEARGWGEAWPRNMPDGCMKFGFKNLCPYVKVCEGVVVYDLVQLGVNPLDISPNISYSSLKDLKRCPEYYRLKTLDKMVKTEGEDGWEAGWGSAVHRGLAEVYRQGKEMQG